MIERVVAGHASHLSWLGDTVIADTDRSSRRNVPRDFDITFVYHVAVRRHRRLGADRRKALPEYSSNRHGSSPLMSVVPEAVSGISICRLN